jgi:hypothetical protein
MFGKLVIFGIGIAIGSAVKQLKEPSVKLAIRIAYILGCTKDGCCSSSLIESKIYELINTKQQKQTWDLV